MTPDTSSLPAYLRSLNVRGPVSMRPGRLVNGPPMPVFDVILRLGLAPFIFDTPPNRRLFERIGLDNELLATITRRVRTRAMWAPVLEELAQAHIVPAVRLAKQGPLPLEDEARETAVRHIRRAITLLALAQGGDGYYFFSPMTERQRQQARVRRLYELLRQVTGARPQRVTVRYARGVTRGLLHLPPADGEGPARRPALLALHPLGGDKDSFDWFLALFRAAGYATFALDLPGHGESFDGPRLIPESEDAALAALDVLAEHPAIDADRLGVLGGSMGGFFALRTAAASERVKACVSFAAPFDLGVGTGGFPPAAGYCFAWMVGASTPAGAREAARHFTLRGVVEKIRAPICLVHGTRDHVSSFDSTFQVASRAAGPVTVFPLVGADHEVAAPTTLDIAGPALDWLRGVL